MRKFLSLTLCILLLFSIVGCSGSQSEPSSEPDIEDPNAYLTDLFHGIYVLEEREGAYGDAKIGGGSFVPLRFSHDRLADYDSYNKTAKIKAPYYECTTGVRMDFYTDAQSISFDYTVTASFGDTNPDCPIDTFNIYENGEFKASQQVKKSEKNTLVYTPTSADAENRITILFPNYHGVALSRFELGNTRPVTDYSHKILVLGDSISQGLYADKPADAYVHQVATALNADYMNLSVGGEIYREEALDEDVHFNPTHIIVALGTNDYYAGISPSKLKSNATSYLQKLKEIYPDVSVTVISPFGNFPLNYHQSIEQAAISMGYDFVNGTTLISQYVSSWNNDQIHPCSVGFNEITAALTPILQQKLS